MDVIGSDQFSVKLAERLEADHIMLERRMFQDGEVCPRLLRSPGNKVILAERMGLPLYPNRYFTEVFLTLKNLKHMRAENITMVMPYFIYSRQDKSFRPGEPFSAKHVLDLFGDIGVSRLFTVSCHMERFKDKLTAPIPAYNVDGYTVLGEHLRNLKLNDPVVTSPNFRFNMAVERVAAILGAKLFFAERGKAYDFNEQDVIIVNDIISSGDKIIRAAEAAERFNCGRIVAAAVHVVHKDGIERLRKYVSKVIATDTIDTPVSEASVIDKLAEAIRGKETPAANPDIPKNAEGAFSWF